MDQYKRKPLYIHKELPDDIAQKCPHLDDANSWLCCFIYQYIIYNRQIQNFHSEDEIRKYSEFIKTLSYFFTYRTVTPQALELALLGFEASSRSPHDEVTPLGNDS